MVGKYHETIQKIIDSGEFVELHPAKDLIVDLKYASTDNFVGRNLYEDFNRAFLHKDAFQKFSLARNKLQSLRPGYSFIVFDVLRPRSVQWLLWNVVVNTPQEIYIANPERGSMHNYGLALDLSIVDDKGQELDMGTAFDSFQELAQPQKQDEFISLKQLSEKQIENRKLLCEVMDAGSFIQLPTEWWHFDAYPREHVRANYQIIE